MIKHLFNILFFLIPYFQLEAISQRERLAYKIMNSFAHILEKEGFATTSVGGGQKEGKQDMLDMGFRLQEVLTIESGRKYCVEKSLQFLDYINSKKDFQKYLIEYPLSLKHIAIIISGNDPCENHSNEIKTVMLVNGKVCYFPKVRSHPTSGPVYQESFEDALAKLNEPPKALK